MFRKILFTILCLFVLSGSALATNYYIDTACANNGLGTWDSSGDGCDDDGGGTDGAFNNLRDVIQLGTLSAGDKIWVRRTSSWDEGVANVNADTNLSVNGTAIAPISLIGYPRASHSVSSSDWTNGSTSVVIDDADMDREQHLSRWITGPDGFDYLITKITDASNIVIDRPYAGTTSSNDATAVIKADEDYTEAAALEGGEVLTDWGGDADDIPYFDYNDEDYEIRINGDFFWVFKNMIFRDSTDAKGIFQTTNCSVLFKSCLFSQATQNDPHFYLDYDAVLTIDQCVFDGDTGHAIGFFRGAVAFVKNSAIYGMVTGFYGTRGEVILENVNIGVEAVNSSADINYTLVSKITGRDVKLGGTNGYVSINTYANNYNSVKFVNYQKVLGAYKEWYLGGTAEKVAVTSTNANKKLSDNVIEITPNTVNTYQHKEIEQKVKVWESRKTYDAGTYNVKVWIFNDTDDRQLNDTTFSDDICMRCRAEAGNYGDATTEYVSMPWIYSDEIDIAIPANADDWDYLQCDSVVVDVSGSKIYCEILVSTFDAEADCIYIDPESSNP